MKDRHNVKFHLTFSNLSRWGLLRMLLLRVLGLVLHYVAWLPALLSVLPIYLGSVFYARRKTAKAVAASKVKVRGRGVCICFARATARPPSFLF